MCARAGCDRRAWGLPTERLERDATVIMIDIRGLLRYFSTHQDRPCLCLTVSKHQARRRAGPSGARGGHPVRGKSLTIRHRLIKFRKPSRCEVWRLFLFGRCIPGILEALLATARLCDAPLAEPR
ncbi:hypothetical protein AGR5A_Cc190170 [Agrobacterium genomosp. 5 str. CFBP 6626]|nr:hypothetical protein AGR5A_Cc190170 [Agrobacterium genomosp. 5 str. CFBP 6626]